MITYVSKYKAGTIVYVLDSEKEDETKKESSEDEADVFLEHHFESGIAAQYFHLFEEKAYNDKCVCRNITSPYIKGFHIPPEA